MSWSEDRPLPEDEAIGAAHPTLTGRHDIYAEAMRLVGAKHSKGALVALVNWLLAERDAFKSDAEAWRKQQQRKRERDDAAERGGDW